ncbi:hypothetical protein ABID56_000044 [Alkalibacillus flavidus]|uniref:Aspartyl-phosphate phosphatase Spo0E family protein n=1 Tax=Alkalibacillus flavidus TaxID=546021 RepID=A0ABV2KQW5_9BACI
MKRDDNLIELEHKIEILRQDMMNTATEEGYTSDKSVRLSQQLDTLLNEYYERTQRKPKSKSRTE